MQVNVEISYAGDCHKQRFPKKETRTGGKQMEKQSRHLCRADKRELRVLADDFGLLGREDVRRIIETCGSYAEGQMKILRIYTKVYMK